MDSLNTRINEVNKKFKTNALISGVINIAILALVFVFFSIGFDVTKSILKNVFSLNWGTIFPSLLDLTTIALLIKMLRVFARILNKPDFFLHVDVNETQSEATSKTTAFFKNDYLEVFHYTIIGLIALTVLNLIFNICLEGINKQFSPINEWYLLSSYFTSLPIFPIQLICIIVLMGVFLPTALNYANYKLEIAQIYQTKESQIEEYKNYFKLYKFWIIVIVSLLCIGMSLLQRNNAWIFQYNTPIDKKSVLYSNFELENLCNLTYIVEHTRDVVVQTEMKHDILSGPYIVEKSYAITPELKQTEQSRCVKKD